MSSQQTWDEHPDLTKPHWFGTLINLLTDEVLAQSEQLRTLFARGMQIIQRQNRQTAKISSDQLYRELVMDVAVDVLGTLLYPEATRRVLESIKQGTLNFPALGTPGCYVNASVHAYPSDSLEDRFMRSATKTLIDIGVDLFHEGNLPEGHSLKRYEPLWRYESGLRSGAQHPGALETVPTDLNLVGKERLRNAVNLQSDNAMHFTIAAINAYLQRHPNAIPSDIQRAILRSTQGLETVAAHSRIRAETALQKKIVIDIGESDQPFYRLDGADKMPAFVHRCGGYNPRTPVDDRGRENAEQLTALLKQCGIKRGVHSPAGGLLAYLTLAITPYTLINGTEQIVPNPSVGQRGTLFLGPEMMLR